MPTQQIENLISENHKYQHAEDFHMHLIATIAAAAGAQLFKQSPDVNGIDWSIQHPNFLGFTLFIQGKTVSGKMPTKESWSYSLDIDTYEKVTKSIVPTAQTILLIHYIPKNTSNWVFCGRKNYSMHNIGFWALMNNLPPSQNKTSASIRIEKTHKFTPQTIINIFSEMKSRIENG